MLHDMAKMSVTGTPGTGTITLNAAISGFQTFDQAGVRNTETVSYTILDGANWEMGRGIYTTSGTTLSRGPLYSSNSGGAVSLTSAAIVEIAALAQDMPNFEASAAFPLLNDFTQVNPGAGVFTDTQTGVNMLPEVNSGVDFALFVKSAPVAPFTFTTRFAADLPPQNTSAVGLCVRNSSNGRFVSMCYVGVLSGMIFQMLGRNYTDPTTFSSNFLVDNFYLLGRGFWLRATVSSTTIVFDASADGYTWNNLSSETIAGFLTAAGGAADQIGVCVTSPSDGVQQVNATLNYFDTAAPV